MPLKRVSRTKNNLPDITSLTDNSTLLHHYRRKNLSFHCTARGIFMIKCTISLKNIQHLNVIYSTLNELFLERTIKV
ncbi:hypothetical protein Xets_00880 [Xenorhabdus sp. TS4]|nr:hypothetical protein [Xenorhabdus sp. TS4]